MASSVFRMVTNNIDDLYTQERIRHRIEDQLSTMSASAAHIDLEDHVRNRYEYDFYNLLHLLGYPASAHYAILRLNGYTHPHQYTVDRAVLLVPDESQLRWLHDIHRLYRRYTSAA